MGLIFMDKCSACGERIEYDDVEEAIEAYREGHSDHLEPQMAGVACNGCGKKFHRACTQLRVKEGWFGDTAVMTCPSCGEESKV